MMGRRQPMAEPALYVGVVTAVLEALVVARARRGRRRTSVLWAVLIAVVGAVMVRGVVTPYFDAPEEVSENAGLPPSYRPPPAVTP